MGWNAAMCLLVSGAKLLALPINRPPLPPVCVQQGEQVVSSAQRLFWGAVLDKTPAVVVYDGRGWPHHHEAGAATYVVA